MAIIEMKIPTSGESITEVTIAELLVEEGSYVEMDQSIMEVETDKANMELPAEAAGIVSFKVEAGDDVAVGTIVATINTDANDTSSAADVKEEPVTEQKEEKPTVEESPKETSETTSNTSGKGMIEMQIPSSGESITEVTIAELLVEDGSYVEMDQPIIEVETDKANMELPAEAAGIVHFTVEAGDDVSVGTVVAKIDTSANKDNNSQNKSEAKEETKTASTTPSNGQNKTYATGHPSPAAAKLISENKLEGTAIKGTGPDGRITKEDVVKHLQQKPVQKQQAAPSVKKEAPKKVEETPSTVQPGSRGIRKEKMSRLRKTISRRLLAAKNDTAMLTTFNEVDLTEVMEIRKKYKETFKEKHEIGLGFMSFFSKACAMALMEYPLVNGYIDTEAGEIEYHDFVDISIAVSTPRGLVVPVLRNVETMTLEQIEKGIKALALKGRDGKLTMDEMTGGTFTISNGGIFGSLNSTPIINPPQSAILGMHKIQERVMVINGEMKIRPMMYLAVSYDHRIIDGKEAVRFLVRVKELLEEPMKMFLNI
ncbi:MAG: 2-oxoglutarate dehydrogenase complex dihydrolipoyllysine-residue succinyltransferase [Chitinophagales bacterium]